MSPFNHCGKCKHLKRYKPHAILDKKGHKIAEYSGGFAQALGAYTCQVGGRWWLFRPTDDTCEKFEHK